LIKDVATREKINDISVLQRIVQFLCSATGSPVSIKKISDTLISGGRKISVNTVDHYVRALTDSYIFYEVPRFDIQGKQILKTLSKFYLADTGFRPLLLETSEQDMGHVLENIVYLELRRRYQNVCIGKAGEYEVDFVARSENETFYYQVAATVLDPQTLRRELYPLEHIKDNYPKYLLTLDEYVQDENYNGIQQLNVIDWLLNTKQ
jgi:predicted AAA+ superfamily ATPase